jgi:para-aminobenzoate synthetase / 4-amino-4-deoxychorismate lyase
MLGDAPFVLLDDARVNGAVDARLYLRPFSVITASTLAEVRPALDAVRGAHLEGHHVAGFMAYEAGHALEPRLATPGTDGGPLLWFGVFDGFQSVAPADVPRLLPDPAGAWLHAPRPTISRADYLASVDRVQALIDAGDIYQANLTFGCDVAVLGHPLAAYAGLRARAAAGYGGVVWTGEQWLLSLSPELFFAVKDGRITAKPMKGTAARILPGTGRGTSQGLVEEQGDVTKPLHHAAHGSPPRSGEDHIIEALRNDPKQRAENLMIVDLLRNDLSRVAVAGSVAVPKLFTVETYPTVHTMTSTVTAQLKPEAGAVDVIETIFPCGSITGAPKIRAMEIVDAVEVAPRGIYTGSIGRIDPGGDAAFNVAIRTLAITGEGPAKLGLGSGIVADSVAAAEWDECLAKGRFVADPRCIDLIETMRFDPAGGIHLLDRHVARIGASARAFGIPFDRHAVRNALQSATFRIDAPRKVRLLLSQSGRTAIEIAPLPPVKDGPLIVALAAMTAHPRDIRLAHKTIDRSVYPRVPGADETLSIDASGHIVEGSYSTVFVKGDGVLLTPPLSRGILPGVLRAELIANGSAVEADLRPTDLADGFFIGNALRGLLPAMLKPL